ncbi:MAG: hypothetical protein ACRCUS_01285 [Anaerovoracaceae bacterium]
MERKTIYDELVKARKGAICINQSQLGRFLGWDKQKVRNFVSGLEYFDGLEAKDGKSHYFLIKDIAKRIDDNKKRKPSLEDKR